MAAATPPNSKKIKELDRLIEVMRQDVGDLENKYKSILKMALEDAKNNLRNVQFFQSCVVDLQKIQLNQKDKIDILEEKHQHTRGMLNVLWVLFIVSCAANAIFAVARLTAVLK